MTSEHKLNKAFESLNTTALKVKADRDRLLAVCKRVYQELDERYDVDQPELGHYKEYPFSGCGELMSLLRKAIEKAEQA